MEKREGSHIRHPYIIETSLKWQWIMDKTWREGGLKLDEVKVGHGMWVQ